MKAINLVLIFASFFVFTSLVAASTKFDLFIWVAHWPTSLTTTPVPKNVTTFQIHGLWPEYDNASWPQYCTNEAFNVQKIMDLYPYMEEYWFDLYEGSGGTGLWEHEWDKHGTCAINGQVSSLTTQHDYFQTGLQLYNYFPLLKALGQSNIYPSSTAVHTVTELTDAIKKGVGVTPMLTCNYENNKHQLEEVRFCVSLQLKPIECPSAIVSKTASSSGCPKSDKDIYILPIIH
eukprot:TRINITY_DN429_c0_g1_i1.p1 TRINITY_DN429_c0_g1~~TRINITY_DN429_c0_g1_i1.p1  ORF type:complete len:233 (+),score=101.09 TRINITY_DN429_c0_g1_i1:182-880(+)